MSSGLAIIRSPDPPIKPTLGHLADLAVLGLNSPSSQRNYRRCLRLYLATGLPLNREGVQAWLVTLRRSRVGPVSINVALAAVKLLAREAHARGLLDDSALSAIERIRGQRVLGSSIGRWLELTEIEMLLDAARNPRDRALIACMIGCGFRRAEVVRLTWDQYQKRSGRAVWVDIAGKGGRVRSIPVPEWVEEALETYRAGGGAADGPVFPVSADTAYRAVQMAARRAGIGTLRPHDLRRTTARQMLAGGGALDQIQRILGHASLQTTERYLGQGLELRPGKAANDLIVLPGRSRQPE